MQALHRYKGDLETGTRPQPQKSSGNGTAADHAGWSAAWIVRGEIANAMRPAFHFGGVGLGLLGQGARLAAISIICRRLLCYKSRFGILGTERRT